MQHVMLENHVYARRNWVKDVSVARKLRSSAILQFGVDADVLAFIRRAICPGLGIWRT